MTQMSQVETQYYPVIDSDDVYEALEMLAAIKKRTEKEDMLRRLLAGNQILEEVLKAALDPYITYGVAQVSDKPINTGKAVFNVDTWVLLDLLRTRGLTGNSARDAVFDEVCRLSHESVEVFKRILTKDLRAGFTANTVDKVQPGLIPTFGCMLAYPFDVKKVKSWPVIVEPKLDGIRCLAFVYRLFNKVDFFTRSGKPINSLDHLRDLLLKQAPDFPYDMTVLDGEIVSGSFNKTVSEVRKKDEQAADAAYVIFDILPIFAMGGEGSECAGNQMERRRRLDGLFDSVVSPKPLPDVYATPYSIESNEEWVRKCYQSYREQGFEGVLVKDPDAYYHRKRNAAWMKIKDQNSVDVRIVGASQGTGKYENSLGGITVNFNGVDVNVGSGFTDEQRQSIWDDDNGTNLIGRIAEVEYHEVTPDGSLRHPRFVGFRDTISHGEKE